MIGQQAKNIAAAEQVKSKALMEHGCMSPGGSKVGLAIPGQDSPIVLEGEGLSVQQLHEIVLENVAATTTNEAYLQKEVLALWNENQMFEKAFKVFKDEIREQVAKLGHHSYSPFVKSEKSQEVKKLEEELQMLRAEVKKLRAEIRAPIREVTFPTVAQALELKRAGATTPPWYKWDRTKGPSSTGGKTPLPDGRTAREGPDISTGRDTGSAGASGTGASGASAAPVPPIPGSSAAKSSSVGHSGSRLESPVGTASTLKVSLNDAANGGEPPAAQDKGAAWTEARTKKLRIGLKDKLKELDGEAVRQLLRQKPPVEDRAQSVEVLNAHFELGKEARESPVVAWKALLRSFGCPRPVWISLINATRVELYFEDKDMAAAKVALLKERVLVDRPRLSKVGQVFLGPSDAERRRGVYERAYFRPLRHAAFHGLSKEEIGTLLDSVEAAANVLKDNLKKKQRLYHIRVDRDLFLQEKCAGDNSDVVDRDEVEASTAGQLGEGSA
jgi:hypothetical protein